MNKIWPWIIGIAVVLIIGAFLYAGSSDRTDYWIARGAVPRPIQVTQAENITLVRFPCDIRAGSIQDVKECGFYVWKK
jgi:hypothetical protein